MRHDKTKKNLDRVECSKCGGEMKERGNLLCCENCDNKWDLGITQPMRGFETAESKSDFKRGEEKIKSGKDAKQLGDQEDEQENPKIHWEETSEIFQPETFLEALKEMPRKKMTKRLKQLEKTAKIQRKDKKIREIKNIGKTYFEVRRKSEELHLVGKMDKDLALELSKKVCRDIGLNKAAQSKENWGRAILTYMCYLNGVPWSHMVTLFEKNGVKDAELKKLKNGFDELKNQLDYKKPEELTFYKRDIDICIDKIKKEMEMGNSQFDGNIKEQAKMIIEELYRDDGFNQSKNGRRSISLGVLNYLRETENLDISQENLADTLDRSESTARKVKNNIKEWIKGNDKFQRALAL